MEVGCERALEALAEASFKERRQLRIMWAKRTEDLLGEILKKLPRESQSDFQITPKYSQECLGQDNALLFQKIKYVLCSVNLNLVKDIHHNCVPNQPC